MSGEYMGALRLLEDRLFCRGLARGLYRAYVAGLGLTGNERVLEVGCGSGALSRYLAEALLDGGGRLTCTDVSEAWARLARRSLRRFPNADLLVGRLPELGLPDTSFDVAVIHMMLHDVEADGRPALLDAVGRALKPTGRLFLREPTSKSHGLPADEVRRLLSRAGFAELSFSQYRLLGLRPVYAGVFGRAGGAAGAQEDTR